MLESRNSETWLWAPNDTIQMRTKTGVSMAEGGLIQPSKWSISAAIQPKTPTHGLPLPRTQLAASAKVQAGKTMAAQKQNGQACSSKSQVPPGACDEVYTPEQPTSQRQITSASTAPGAFIPLTSGMNTKTAFLQLELALPPDIQK
jgi:hypothetical protein